MSEYIPWWKRNDDDFDATQDVDPTVDYTEWQMEQMANELLRKDSKREMCRRCGEYGDLSGEVEALPQADEDGDPVVDEEGNTLFVDFPEMVCQSGHRWYEGEGKARSIQGANPILFENHLQDRRRREIYTSIGTPDPSIQQGIYNRSHPQGRKINTESQRKKHGASYYK